MLHSSNLSPRTSLAVLLSIALVSGCSSSDNDTAADPGTDETPTDPDNGGDIIEEGPPPGSPAINPSNARNLAIETLELTDILVYSFSNTSALLLNSSTPAGCGTSGSFEVVGGTTQTFNFADCQLGGEGPRLTGQIAYDGAFDNGFTGNQSFTELQIVSGTRVLSINGTAAVVSTPGSIAVSAADLVVNDSQSDVTLTQSTVTISNAGSAQQNVQVNLTAAAPRFGLTAATVTSSGLTGQAVTCPQSGTLNVDAQDDGALLVTGAVGSNLTFDVADTSDTLACAEVAILVADNNDDITTPPGVPGGL